MRASAGRSASDSRTSPLNARSRSNPFARQPRAGQRDRSDAGLEPQRAGHVLAVDRPAADVGRYRPLQSADRNAPFEHLHVIDRRRARQSHGDIGPDRGVGGVSVCNARTLYTRGRVVDRERHARQLRGVRRATLDRSISASVRSQPSIRTTPIVISIDSVLPAGSNTVCAWRSVASASARRATAVKSHRHRHPRARTIHTRGLYFRLDARPRLDHQPHFPGQRPAGDAVDRRRGVFRQRAHDHANRARAATRPDRGRDAGRRSAPHASSTTSRAPPR